MSTLFAKLQKGWRWVNAGETTNPERDFHCWPPGSGKSLCSIQETWKMNGTHYGMVIRNEGPAVSHLHSFDVSLR